MTQFSAEKQRAIDFVQARPGLSEQTPAGVCLASLDGPAATTFLEQTVDSVIGVATDRDGHATSIRLCGRTGCRMYVVVRSDGNGEVAGLAYNADTTQTAC